MPTAPRDKTAGRDGGWAAFAACALRLLLCRLPRLRSALENGSMHASAGQETAASPNTDSFTAPAQLRRTNQGGGDGHGSVGAHVHAVRPVTRTCTGRRCRLMTRPIRPRPEPVAVGGTPPSTRRRPARRLPLTSPECRNLHHARRPSGCARAGYGGHTASSHALDPSPSSSSPGDPPLPAPGASPPPPLVRRRRRPTVSLTGNRCLAAAAAAAAESAAAGGAHAGSLHPAHHPSPRPRPPPARRPSIPSGSAAARFVCSGGRPGAGGLPWPRAGSSGDSARPVGEPGRAIAGSGPAL
jgi:hypothetical protein